MANLEKKTITKEVVTTVEEYVFILTLTLGELKVLKLLTGRVHGPTGEHRKNSQAVYSALDEIGVDVNVNDLDGEISFNK